MATTAIATLQTIWDCKWSRLAYKPEGDQPPPESLWICVRPGRVKSSVTAEECVTCPHWEATDDRGES